MKRISKSRIDRFDHCMQMINEGFVPYWINPEEIKKIAEEVGLSGRSIPEIEKEVLKVISMKLTTPILEVFYNYFVNLRKDAKKT